MLGWGGYCYKVRAIIRDNKVFGFRIYGNIKWWIYHLLMIYSKTWHSWINVLQKHMTRTLTLVHSLELQKDADLLVNNIVFCTQKVNTCLTWQANQMSCWLHNICIMTSGTFLKHVSIKRWETGSLWCQFHDFLLFLKIIFSLLHLAEVRCRHASPQAS